MSTLSYIGLLGGVFSLMGYAPFIRSVMRGEAEPERARWFIISLSNILILLSYFVLGARTTIFVPIAYALGTTAIALLSLRYGRSGWGIVEQSTLVIAIISAIRWVFFNNVFLTLIAIFSIGMIGYVQRFRKLIADSDDAHGQEDPVEWSMFFIGGFLNLIAVSQWTLEIALFPILIFVLNGAVFALVLRNTLRRTHHNDENDSHIS